MEFFHADIQTICFYNHKILKYDIRNEVMQDTMEMILDVHKYRINTASQTENLDPTMITE